MGRGTRADDGAPSPALRRLPLRPGSRLRLPPAAAAAAAAAATTSPPLDPSAATLRSFLSWLGPGAGARASKLSVTIGASTRGVSASEAIAPGDVLVTLPLAACLVDPGPGPGDPPRLPGSPRDTLTWGPRLAARLLRERSLGPAASAWGPYIAALPGPGASEESESLPLFFGGELLAEMQYEPLVAEVLALQRLARSEYERVGGAQGAILAGASYEEWAWALSMVYSRSFAIKRGGSSGGGGALAEDEEDLHALLPLIDLLNHGGDVLRPTAEEPWAGTWL